MAEVRRVIAVFRHRARAEQVREELEGTAIEGVTFSIEDRRATDDTPEAPPAPAIEGDERSRDKEVAGHVFKSAVGLSVMYAVGGAVVFGVVAGLIAGWGDPMFWIAIVVGAVTGTVLGGVQGGIGAAMTESEKEEGSLLVAECATPDAARRVEKELRRFEPERIDTSSGTERRLAG